MDAAEIFLRGRWKVGGRWVGPVTLGHAMLLEAFQLLDVSTPRSYALALLLLERPWHEFARTMASRWFALRLVIRELKSDAAQRAALQSMITAALEMPPLLYKEGTRGARGGAPSVLGLRVYLIEKMGRAPAEVMAAPMAEVVADVAVSLEINGAAQIMDAAALEQARANALPAAMRN